MKSTLLDKKSFPITRYTVPKLEGLDFAQVAEPYKFKSIDDTLDELEVGWVLPKRPFEPERWGLDECRIGDLLHISIRVDERVVSTSALEKNIAIAEEKLKLERQIPRLSRPQRLEIKEAERLKLLRRAMLSTALFEVVWRLETKEVWLLADSTRAKVLFEELFNTTFGILPVELVHYKLAQQLVTAELLGKVTPHISDEADLVSVIAEKQDMAKDFMLWIWHNIDMDSFSSPPEVQGEKENDLVQGVPLIHLTSNDGKESVICKGGEQMNEAMEALRQGKRPVQFSFVVNDFWFTVKAPSLSIHALGVPLAAGDEGQDDAGALVRADSIAGALAKFDHYYKMWLELHADDGVLADYCADLGNWISEKEEKKKTEHGQVRSGRLD